NVYTTRHRLSSAHPGSHAPDPPPAGVRAASPPLPATHVRPAARVPPTTPSSPATSLDRTALAPGDRQPVEPAGVLRGAGRDPVHGFVQDRRDPRSHVREEGRLVPFSPQRDRREVRAVRLDQEPVRRDEPHAI